MINDLDFVTLLVIGFVVVFGAHCIWCFAEEKLYSLVPWIHGIPFLGSLISLLYDQVQFHTKILPKLGPIARYSIGTKQYVCFNDTALIQTVFKSNNCINRPQWMQNIFHQSNCPLNIMNSNQDQHWKKRRKFVVNAIAHIANRFVLFCLLAL